MSEGTGGEGGRDIDKELEGAVSMREGKRAGIFFREGPKAQGRGKKRTREGKRERGRGRGVE